jgi:hypothetical protein
MTDLLALAERCESAVAPSFDLDKAILRALGFTWRGMNYWSDDRTMWKERSDFTTSIDGALVLIPEGWHFSGLDQQSPAVRVWTEGNVAYYSPGLNGLHAATPALAICAAALRARSFQVVGRGKQT